MKKAMTMPMTLVITIVVLLIVAAIVISITSNRLNKNDENLETEFDLVGEKLTDLVASAGDENTQTTGSSNGKNFPKPSIPSPFK